MVPDFSALTRLLIAFVALDLLMLAVLLLTKVRYRYAFRRRKRLAGLIQEQILDTRTSQKVTRMLRKNFRLFLRLLKELEDSVLMPNEVRQRWLGVLHSEGYIGKLASRLSSPFRLRRMEAVTSLGIIGGEDADEGLLRRLPDEPAWHIRLVIIEILCRHEYRPALPQIFSTLKSAPKWVRQKSFSVLPNFGEELDGYLDKIITKREEGDLELLFELGERYRSETLNSFLEEHLRSSHATLARRAALALEKTNPKALQSNTYYKHEDDTVREAAMRSLRWRSDEETMHILLEAVRDGSRSVRRAAVGSLQEFVATNPHVLDHVVETFMKSSEPVQRKNLARVLESRIEYFLFRVNSDKYRTVKALVEELAGMGRLSVIFGFLEKNRGEEIEAAILDILRGIIAHDPDTEELTRRYIAPKLLEKLGLERREIASSKKHVPLGRGDRRLLIAVLVLTVLSLPLSYLMLSWGNLPSAEQLGAHLAGFSETYTFVFAFYSMAINSIYILLLLFALFHLFRQIRWWRLSSFHLLFAKDLLPSISILAPAYNEELNIVDNVKSLLNLHYPDVEIIIINDGSGDRTLERLIESFTLERVDREGEPHIETEPVRGIYVSRQFPNLTVIDKVNGGKADSLNAGINLAHSDFICTIDSDSILENDALLKAAFHTVLTDREPLALGGNIIPANGCTVRNGTPVKIALAKDHLSRFQTIEYMRAFLAGRLGWSLINSMVIISGAFGLFIRKRVIEVGGYLTPRSRHRASTVGEDMELVVRLHEHMRRKKLPYKVYDVFNANCWTEVPNRFKILHRQRDRWHRGLLESVLLHKQMAFNPKFGAVGSVAFPYFLVFEIIGPFLELFGYVNLVLSILLGVITGPVALLLFIVVILYGILISIGSLLISENEVLYFSVPETLKIIGYAVIENFGFRQLMSSIRVTAYVSFLFKEKSWGEMERTGFASGQ